MPKLYEITDAYTGDELPVEEVALPTDRPRVIINTAEFDKPKLDWDKGVDAYNSGLSDLKFKASGIADAIKYASELDQKFTSSVLNFPKKAYENSDDLVKGLKNLFGVGEDERYQLWPEKVVREALTSAGDIAKPNPYTEGSEQYYEYEGKRQEGMVPAAMAISALAGSGGLGGTGAKAGEVALGATPFLRPALKHKEKLYKGKPGQEHQDIIPKELYEDFRQKAMSGEDLAEYNFGFINDKGHFLDREKALKYGIDTGLIDPHSGRFGALTTTLMSDSFKPGMAIEAAAKTAKPTLIPAMKINDKIYKGNVGDEHFDIIKKYLNLNDFEEGLKDKRFGFVNNKGHFLDREKAMEYAKSNELIDNKIKSKLLVSTMLLPDGTLHAAPLKRNTVQSKITGQVLYSDSSKPAAALQANRPTFYSAVEHTVNNIPQTKMTGEQWLGTIANKPGVKGEELDWTGLKGFLEENKNKPVTKSQIEEHLASNKVELKEVNKGGENPDLKKYTDDLRAAGVHQDEIDYRVGMINENDKSATKYSSYQLPGGENYREILLTLPLSKTTQRLNAIDKEINELFARKPRNSASFATPEDNATFVRLTQERNNLPKDQFEGNYQSSHWDEPNILAHVRMNDRTIDGKKSLHLEEIQSDWHQQGRDKGYQSKNNKRTEEELAKEIYENFGRTGGGQTWEQLAPTTRNEYLERARAQPELMQKGGVPDAPFKKTWHELALKRMIREAAEKGYDRLSWTPGEAQAARYDLSKQIDKIHYNKKENMIAAYDKNGRNVLTQKASPDELPNIIGKEAADKLLNKGKKLTEDSIALEGQDLKIGGEGMKGFYDQIIPKALEKLTGQKVKSVNTINEDKYKIFMDENRKYLKDNGIKDYLINKMDDRQISSAAGKMGEWESLLETKNAFEKYGKQPIHYIDITPELKQKALQKGFPLFSNAHPGYTFIPYDGNPFENKQ